MKILILGGPKFLGYHLIEAAKRCGHDVTLFNRGKTFPHLFPGVEKLAGDRDGGLEVIKGRKWDAAIDTSGYVPRLVQDSAGLLADSVGHYTFVSTISVYSGPTHSPLDENAPVGTLEDEAVEEITGETYGPLKALCEQAAEAAMPGRVFNVRPGLIVGPRDPTERFTYWPLRAARGGEILAPHSASHPYQIIDVRDLAEWIIRGAEDGLAGVFNATGHSGNLGDALNACLAVTGSGGKLVWVPEQVLSQHEISPWMEFPLWLPSDSHDMMRVSIDKALAAGLVFRPLEETIADTLEWANRRGPGFEVRPTLAPEKERRVLAAWAAGQSA